MQQISFVKISPTQNVTVLVTQPVPRAEQAAMAAQLLAYDGVGGEQVGFLEKPSLPGALARLQMMGGEFCGNASMSVGAYLAWKDGLEDGASRDYALEVSGAEGLTVCRIERRGDAFSGTVRMPFPERIEQIRLETDAGERTFPAVVLPGITHVIAQADEGLSCEEIERRIRSWNDEIRADALGVLRYDPEEKRMQPAVYVPATDSVVWERGCGSGTAAIGCWMTCGRDAAICETIRQPGGEIVVRARAAAGKIEELTITGTVRMTAEGTAFL